MVLLILDAFLKKITMKKIFLLLILSANGLAQNPILAQSDTASLKKDTLRRVEIRATRRDNFTSTLNPLNVETIGAGELKKAACCNLSESFETNGTVDVAYSDAVTGAKELQMLGLRGAQTQVLVEGRTDLAGLAQPYGLEYLPGTWLSDIALSKGASTVALGVNGIAGQINACLKQPENMERLFVNLFASSDARTEANLHFSHRFSDSVSTALLLHYTNMWWKLDNNKDNFADMPHRQQYNMLNRWKLTGKNWIAQINAQALRENRDGGSIDTVANEHAHHGGAAGYNFGMQTERLQLYGKYGYTGFAHPYQSFGSIYSLTQQTMVGNFGTNAFVGNQATAVANFLYETIITDTNNKLKLGVGYTYDRYSEKLAGGEKTYAQSRTEQTPHAFAEYNFSGVKNLNILTGIRLEYSTLYGAQIVPRANVKYNFDENTVVRASAGRGVRTASVLPENFAWLTSDRILQVQNNIQQETAWNYGVNFTHNFQFDMHTGSLTLDVYRTDFSNQIVTDLDTDAQTIFIRNSAGQRSFANSAMLSASYILLPRLELRAAYKYTDAQQTTGGVLQSRVLTAPHRALLNLNYKTFDKS